MNFFPQLDFNTNPPLSKGVPPGEDVHFDVEAAISQCNGDVTVLFDDGRCETTSPTPEGCERIQTHLHSTYEELLQTRELVAHMTSSPQDFPTDLHQSLEIRREYISNRQANGYSKTEAAGRSSVIQRLESALPPANKTAPRVLSSRESAMTFLDLQIAGLAAQLKLIAQAEQAQTSH